jgi:hypothetical protein
MFGGVSVTWHICQDAQCGQPHPIRASHAESRQVACHLPDDRVLHPKAHVNGIEKKKKKKKNAYSAPEQKLAIAQW